MAPAGVVSRSISSFCTQQTPSRRFKRYKFSSFSRFFFTPQSLQAKLSFSSKEIVALSCAWCKSSYHNKEACFNPQRIGEECSLGEIVASCCHQAGRHSFIKEMSLVKKVSAALRTKPLLICMTRPNEGVTFRNKRISPNLFFPLSMTAVKRRRGQKWLVSVGYLNEKS